MRLKNRSSLVCLLPLLFALAPSFSFAQLGPPGWKPTTETSWGGLNLLPDTTLIPTNDSPDAVNVMTDSGYLEKRPGNVRLTQVLNGYPLTYSSEWLAPSGTRYLIAESSSSVYETDFSSAPVLLSSVAAGYTIDPVAAFSKLWVADGYEPIWDWNETSTETVVDAQGNKAPECTFLTFANQRLYCANIPGGTNIDGEPNSSSALRISSEGAGSY